MRRSFFFLTVELLYKCIIANSNVDDLEFHSPGGNASKFLMMAEQQEIRLRPSRSLALNNLRIIALNLHSTLSRLADRIDRHVQVPSVIVM